MGSSNGKPVLRPEDVAALVKYCSLDDAQVKESFDAFVEEYPGGKIKPTVFREMMAKALPKKDVRKMEQHVFRVYDTNNDGFIDFTEFMLVLFIMSGGTPEEVFTSIFRMFDLNSDGIITQKEMTKLIKDMYRLLKEEDPNLASKDLVARSAFAEMDADQDGKVTIAEFIAACLGQEEFSKMLTFKVLNIFGFEDKNCRNGEGDFNEALVHDDYDNNDESGWYLVPTTKEVRYLVHPPK
jgi:Ca2+-binding EF-hand superfamily protein